MKKALNYLVLTVAFCSILIMPAAAYTESYDNTSEWKKNQITRTIPDERLLPRVVDNANLLEDYEEASLLAKVNEISERQQVDIVIVTAYSLDGQSPMAYADDFYDYNGYGFGKEKDGILLLVGMENRDWHVTTTGYGITAVTDKGLNYMSDKFLPYMSDGDYITSFETFADLCDSFVTQARTGEPYDIGNLPKEPIGLMWLTISFGIGAVIAFIVLGIMKSKLKSVRSQPAASSYVKSNSMAITDSSDAFLYNRVSKTARVQDSGGGGSSTHSSSSGSSHGGGGGHF